jgi:hypothetical protein
MIGMKKCLCRNASSRPNSSRAMSGNLGQSMFNNAFNVQKIQTGRERIFKLKNQYGPEQGAG